ncbi:hypothetical protein QCA50_002808 [Cerrena zonata]|uniref:Mog1p/PsbP-like protein n=1 Tax=Cerrena zonata TaxID=2478898 RepID=A0AAW0GMV9_9APHY
MSAMVTRELFGGAITMTLPSNLIDASFHFDSLAHDNSAISHSVQETQLIPNDRGDDTPSHTLLSGRQQVAKYNRTTADDIQVFMALYRVEGKNVDLVLTMNVPIASADGGAVSEAGISPAKHDFEVAASSLCIKDFGLFAS